MKSRWPDIIIFAIFCAFVVIAIWLSSAYGQSPTPFDINKVDVSKISADEMAKTIAHRNALFGDEQTANVQTDNEIKIQAQTLVDAASTSDQSQKALAAYILSVKDIVTKANEWITVDKPHILKMLHRAKWIISAEWIAVCALIAWKVGKIPVIGTYLLMAIGGVAIGGIAFIWSCL